MIYSIIAIIFESIDSLFKGIKALLESKELTIGAILAGLAPFVWTLNRIRKEKDRIIRDQRIENRQQRIESKIDDLMRDRGVVSTWSFQETGSTHMVQPNLRKWFSYVPKVSILRRKKLMDKLKSRKLWMAIFGALLPIINEEFNLGLNTDTVIASVVAIVGYVLGQAHVDSKKAVGGSDVKPTINGSSDK